MELMEGRKTNQGMQEIVKALVSDFDTLLDEQVGQTAEDGAHFETDADVVVPDHLVHGLR